MVRSYKKKESRSKEVNEEHMSLAIKDIVEGKLSYRKVADKYGLKASTLESRVKKVRITSNEADCTRFHSKFTSYQVFSVEEESQLSEYIQKSSKMHYGLTILQVRKLAYDYAKALKCKYSSQWDEKQLAGIDWMHGFRNRNRSLTLRKPENTSAARSFAFNKTVVNEFYDNLKSVYERHNFTADRIFNFNESGISTVLETPKVLAPRSQKQDGQIVSGERGELVTFGGIISATGNTIPPLFVFPRVHFKDYFMEGAPEGSIGATNRTGWINSEIFVQVLRHIQKHTLSSKENPILLLCDNHESHISLDAIDYARDNGIVYLSFPPHTSHKLQPLDVGVFGPFKSKLKIAFNNWHVTNPGKTVSIYNIPKIVKIAYLETFMAKNIISGFSSPGIWPYNQLAFSDVDFAPVEVYTLSNTENTLGYQRSNNIISQDNKSAIVPSQPLASTHRELKETVSNASETLVSSHQSVLSDIMSTEVASTCKVMQSSQDTSTEAVSTCQGLQSLHDMDIEAALMCQEQLLATTETIQSLPSSSKSYIAQKTLLSPETVRPYPTAERKKKTTKGRQPGKSRIYTDTPEKIRLENLQKERNLKKAEQERRARAREMKRSLNISTCTKAKKLKKKMESSESESEKSKINIQECSSSDLSDDDVISESEKDKYAVKPENIKALF
ncbi:uncharacterized protein LOC113235308 [Hyposmocoma kahamanoa]|uniref:uncharacterized protein LOC113235308 n=1 Tax=Hyposmocoma kahamanoa TaxID=1477025 RepID=UPI000E6D6AE2|nr:uncharacterized protein LOC113235308 [Hyposmocoma kahamanoa]